MDHSRTWEDALLPWLLKISASVLIAVTIHFVIIPKIKHRSHHLNNTANFCGSGYALDSKWVSANEGKFATNLSIDDQAVVTETKPVPDGVHHQAKSSEREANVSLQKPDRSRHSTLSDGGGPARNEEKPAAPRPKQHAQQRLPEPPLGKARPKLRSKADHPGLGQFHVWYDAISGIYRSYTLGKADGSTPALPIIPRSERGNVPVHLEVKNLTSAPFDAFWVDYLGNEKYKGSAAPGSVWQQKTWIGHPWTFRAQGGKILLHFVPLRVIQTTDRIRTANRYNEGVHNFSVISPSYDAQSQGFVCEIDDPVFPFPSTKIKSAEKAFEWSCRHMERERSSPRGVLKYLQNVLKNPMDPKYRQIRTANRTFWNEVWTTAARGMLHALGFEENGAYVEMGSEGGGLPAERVLQISLAVAQLEAMLRELEGSSGSMLTSQPEGADGFGRAGFGRVGMH